MVSIYGSASNVYMYTIYQSNRNLNSVSGNNMRSIALNKTECVRVVDQLFICIARKRYNQMADVFIDDTNYMADSYTALQYPDREINDVQTEDYCRTHCSGSESCAAYSYNASSATCFLSRVASVIQDDFLENTAYVKKRFSRSLDVLEHPTGM